ncbi:MAG: hypothetical protein GY793_04230 [Proteobacteria bacterium]|nr:hypothetical protein [Pseudomonadota bacterium]
MFWRCACYYFFNGLDDERIDIKDRCHAVLPAIPYTKTKDKWILKNTANQTLKVNVSDETYISDLITNMDIMKQSAWWFIERGQEKRRMYNEKTGKFYTLYDYFRDDGSYCSITGKIQGKKRCIINTIDKPWRLMNGIELDYQYSTTTPITNTYYSDPSGLKKIWNGHVGSTKLERDNQTKTINLPSMTADWKVDPYSCHGMNEIYVQYQCNNPVCDVAHMQKLGVYQRGDETEFIDDQNVLEEKYVCGDGQSLLDLNGAE